jgi:hypothetical protein
LALILLVGHTVRWSVVLVDATSIMLLGVLLVLPLAEFIRRIKIGQYFEAEIGPRDIRNLQESASGVPVSDTAALVTQEDPILSLTHSDPALGLAKLQIELEQTLRSIHRKRVPPRRGPGRPLGVAGLVRDLGQRELIPPDIAAPLQEVVALATQAVHGKLIRTRDAEEVATVGVRLLQILQEDLARSPQGMSPSNGS